MKSIGFAGSFDPITRGHIWVMEEAMRMADNVYVFVAANPSKKTMFSPEKRAEIIISVGQEMGWQKLNVEVVRGDYVAKAAKNKGIEYLLRGVRGAADLDQEHILALTNAEVLGGARTIFVMPPRDLSTVSSSFVKSLIGPAGWHWQVDKFLPKASYEAMVIAWLEEEWMSRVGEGKHLLKKILNIYNKKDRHYHNISHLAHCFSELSRVEIGKEDARIISIALLYHDAIYRDGISSGVSDEEKSADLLTQDAKFVFDNDSIEKARNLILATRHSQKKNGDKLTDLMSSIDLAILGQDEVIYQKYMENVRQEYHDVGDREYRLGRAVVLEKIMETRIFNNKIFYKLYEDKARANISAEIKILKS